MRKQTLFATIASIAIIALTLVISMGAMTHKEFGDTGNRFIAREAGSGSILTSFTATMDIEILSIYLHTVGAPTGGEFSANVSSALVNNPSTAYDYTYVNQDMLALNPSTTMVWPTSTDANHYYLEKEDYVDLLWPNPSTSMPWGLAIYYERR